MDIIENLPPLLSQFLPLLTVIAGLSIVALGISRLLENKRNKISDKSRFSQQMSMLILFAIGIVLIILTLPVSDSIRGQLLGLVGVVFTAIIALSATTFVANIMAGLMLRSVGSFHVGDFIRVGDFFGRVTERDLFHLEIQTEDRDLMTIPNMYLISQPVRVISANGTIVTCDLSLGYDLPNEKMEALLLTAAENTGLKDPFVQIIKLGDFSVSYRVAGFLEEARLILSTRSKLQKEILNSFTAANVEIVSPTFMNQRPLDPNSKIIPSPSTESLVPFLDSQDPKTQTTPEEVMFDKADSAEKLAKLKSRFRELKKEIYEKEKVLSSAQENERLVIEKNITSIQSELDSLSAILGHYEHQNANNK